jgi:hypothetical protein
MSNESPWMILTLPKVLTTLRNETVAIDVPG